MLELCWSIVGDNLGVLGIGLIFTEKSEVVYVKGTVRVFPLRPVPTINKY